MERRVTRSAARLAAGSAASVPESTSPPNPAPQTRKRKAPSRREAARTDPEVPPSPQPASRSKRQKLTPARQPASRHSARQSAAMSQPRYADIYFSIRLVCALMGDYIWYKYEY